MVFSEFAERVKVSIPDYLPGIDAEDITVQAVEKNNGVVCTGLLIREKDEAVSPNIYLEYYYSRYMDGCAMENILRDIAKEYKEVRIAIEKKAVKSFDKQSSRDKVVVKLVNYRDNRKLLKECPYIRFHDLAVMARYIVTLEESGISSTPVTNDDLKIWGISREELFEKALANTRRLLPPKIFKMDELISKSTGIGFGGEFETQAYVLTNSICVNGASAILYKDVVEGFADRFPEGFYILPSSIHEVIIIPLSLAPEKESLKELVREVNREVLTDTDYLSDEVYFYDPEVKNITL